MSERVQKTKQGKKQEAETVEETKQVDTTERDAKLAETDALLDAIDEVIEDIETITAAEEFVAGFVQKGGQ